MTNTQTLKTYNEWRRGADIPQPNPADIGIAIDGVLSELEELKQQVGILASFPLKIRMECRKRIKDANGDEFAAMVLDSASAALNRSSGEQALADIKAQAVMQFTEHVKYTFEGIMSDDALIDFGCEHIANKLKGGE